ncbi:MAG: reverse transcriptase domain-containing protein [Planctomycetota bacterium]
MKDDKSLVALQRQIYVETRHADRPLPQIMPWVVDRRNLEGAWNRVCAASGAKTPGPDGLTTCDLIRRKDRWLSELAAQLYRGEYRPAPPRWVDVPKDNGSSHGKAETRRLGVLNVADRVVQAAFKQVLEPLFEPRFSPDSFGFRPGRSVPAALDIAVQALNGTRAAPRPFNYLVKLDVADCFGTINHSLITKRLQEHLADEGALLLLDRMLKACIVRRPTFWQQAAGIVQGGSLSPLLCNFYLDPLDQQLGALAAQTGNGIRALRYADDLLILAGDRGLARRALSTTKRVLSGLKQRVCHEKTSIVRAEDGVRWLGVTLLPIESESSGGQKFAYFIPREKLPGMLSRISEMTVPPSTRINASAFDLGQWLVSINEQLDDWWYSYLFAENARQIFREVDQHTFERVGELLSRITGQRLRSLYTNHLVRLPRGFKTWQVQGKRLAVLSSLAPRAPFRLIHHARWMQRPRQQATTR